VAKAEAENSNQVFLRQSSFEQKLGCYRDCYSQEMGLKFDVGLGINGGKMLDIPVQASFAAIFEKTLPAASIETIRKSHEWAALYFQFSQLSLSDLDASDARKILDLWQIEKETGLPEYNLLAISDQIDVQIKANKILTTW
jgi:hypothetical protein